MTQQARADKPLATLRVFGDPALKQTARPVAGFDDRLERLAKTMFEVMEREDGVGLAAPQIGVLSQVVVWCDPDNREERYVFVNPRIIARSEACTTASEGCLSVPGVTVEVPRADEISVSAQDLLGRTQTWHFTGLRARIIQHEVDHLEGRLILDRASPEERRRVLKELREAALAGNS